MKPVLWIVVIVLLAAAAALIRWGGCVGEEAPGEALSRHSLENATYTSLDAEMGTVRLSGGKLENASAHVWVTLHDTVATGDLDGDRRPEAVVVLATNTGGSGVFHSVHVVRDHSGRPADVASAELGDRIVLKSLAVENGRVVVKMVKHRPGDPMCCPTLRVTQTYEFQESGLVLVEQIPPQLDEDD